MKIFTNKLNFVWKSLFTMLLMMYSVCSFAQTTTIPTPATGDYVSAASGDWSTASTWNVVGAGGTTTPASTAPGQNNNVFISASNVVTLNAAVLCLNLYINVGGTLKQLSTNAGVTSISIGKSTLASGTVTNIINNGTLGSTNSVTAAAINDEKIDILIFNNVASGGSTTFNFTGTGNTKIESIQAQGATSPNVKTMTVNLNTPIVLTGAAGRTLTLCRLSANSLNEFYTMNVNSPISVVSSSGVFNMNGSTTVPGGTYTYNINSTLDFSRSTGTQGIIPLPSSDNTNSATGAINVITLNVNNGGTFIMGSSGFGTNNGTAGTNFSKVALNILDGGLVDASSQTSNSFGTGTTFDNAYFSINGPNKTGKFKRVLTSSTTSDYVFPIGTSAGYSPVIIRNSGTTGAFTVGVINDFTGYNTFTPPVTPAYALKNRFTIDAANAGSVISLLKFGWQANDEGSSFVRTSALALQKYGSGTWATDGNVTASTVSGTGTAAISQNTNATGFAAPDPYLITLTPTTSPVGVIALNADYTISQDATVLPLNFLTLSAKLSGLDGKAELKWSTADEVNTKTFTVLESQDGKTFTEIGNIFTKNTAGPNYYSFITNNALPAGTSYFKIKQVDIDGNFQYSKIVSVLNNASSLAIYPNPTSDLLKISFSGNSNENDLKIYSTEGKLVYQAQLAKNQNEVSINVSNLVKGEYILVLAGDKGNETMKFIKN